MRSFAVCLFVLLLGVPGRVSAAAECPWPAWESFKQAMVSVDGRVIDRSSPRLITTSEGQSYGLFFALLADDRDSFARLLQWTGNNLAAGKLGHRLPAWQWGRAGDGDWRVLDDNNASDADLWLAYSLLEAGRLWRRADYAALGQQLLRRSAAQTVRKLPGLGLMLLPGDYGFDGAEGWRLNPGYLPLQQLARFAWVDTVWGELAANTRRLLLAGAPKGFAPDWLQWKTGQGWAVDPEHGAAGSYDAIRVYLWLGMLADDAPERERLQGHFAPMAQLTARLGQPPEHIDARSGDHRGVGPAGFSAALLPLLAATGEGVALQAQRDLLQRTPPAPDAYYGQVLYLFGRGWDEGRYRFDKDGRLLPAWIDRCKD